MTIDPALIVAAGGFISAIAAVYVSIRNAHSAARKDELSSLREALEAATKDALNREAASQARTDQLEQDLHETRAKLETEIREKRLLMRRVAILESILIKHSIELPPEEGVTK